MLPDIDEFLAQKTIAEATRVTYLSILQRFGVWLDRSNLTFEALKTSDVLRFVKEWGLGSSAGYQAVCAIRGYAAWKYGSNHPATKAKYKRLESAPQRTLNTQQVAQLLGVVTGQTEREIRDKALISLLLDSRLRESEICRLRLDDTNLAEKVLTVLCKGGKYGDGMFSQQTVSAIEKWLEIRARIARPGVKTLFTSVGGNTTGASLTACGLKGIFKVLSKKVGFRISPHDLRRTFACILTENGAPTEMVRRAGRWSSIDMVRLYTRRARIDSIRKFLPLHDPSDEETIKTPKPVVRGDWINEYQ